MSGRLILGCASTGAKFTPWNHRATGDDVLDRICTGASIKAAVEETVEEAVTLYQAGVRYFHYHARNPETREQTTDNSIYQAVSSRIQRECPGMLLSFGASRNGAEVRERVAQFGEWERVSQCALPLHLGGAHFVTIQAAVELQVICEIERKFGPISPEMVSSRAFADIVEQNVPSDNEESASLQTHSTSNGADYGRTSPRVQFLVYSEAVKRRRQLGLLHEIEWVQLDRSYAMARYAIEHPHIRLGDSGQLNVTLLFGFSPRLPFPHTYAEFKAVVDLAKRLEYDLDDPTTRTRRVTISVGAAVLPQQAEEHFLPLDIDPEGRAVCALRRIAAYAAQPDSGVDILRVGMEDTPYIVDEAGRVVEGENADLVAIARDEIGRHGVDQETDTDVVERRMRIDMLREQAANEQRDPSQRFTHLADAQVLVSRR
ncbi:3-keto-5-aminohexanoate cleavage protein [Nocardioides sp. KC13]|uniref:3-keto-5-aminohexanoate cleavage protein n=1 Tax=Nocardioides turkmenicus TaxID=2711220 RepID=A0A6M1QVH0_9ACTN|nr:3-keto-5-aminohexanoate cleavage protein [Nocardioides sp. KC13]NGN91844.1 3-keto-5-aminohexanoate cleavage protein [Nocardioides sp. KC13]